MEIRSIGNKLVDRYSTREGKILLTIAAIVLVMNFCRLYTNCFWGDEAYSINVAKKGVIETVTFLIENDIHPPLYHIIMSLFCNTLGFSPFVYHFVSYLPYFFIILISITYIYKKYGFTSSVVLILLSSFISTSLFFIVEARMYEWGLFFVFCSFILLREVLEDQNRIKTGLFILTSVCSAYTHYYCLLAIAFMYLVLLVYAIYQKKYLKKVLFIFVVSFLAYAPWISVVIGSLNAVSSDFWITRIPDFNECISYMFGSNCIPILFILLLCGVILLFLSKHGSLRKIKLDVENTWIFAGLLVIIGSIVLSTIVSVVMSPVLVTRYLYPVSIVAWVLFAYVLPRCNVKKVVATVLVASLIFCGVVNYGYTTNVEMCANGSTESILNATSEMTSDDLIYTNVQHMDWTMLDYYYPDVPHQYYDSLPSFGGRSTYWLMTSESISEDEVSSIKSQGYNVELKTSGKFAAYNDPKFSNYYEICVYKLTQI